MNLSPDLLKDLALLAGGSIFLVFVMLVALRLYRQSQQRPSDLPPGLTVQDLKGLEQKHLLTPEELKRVREAMARQYLEVEKERQQTVLPAEGLSGVELLAQEAERLAKERAAQPVPKDVPATPPLESAPNSAPQPATAALPEHLRNLAPRSRTDLEDLVLAGFLDRADMEIILKARGETL